MHGYLPGCFCVRFAASHQLWKATAVECYSQCIYCVVLALQLNQTQWRDLVNDCDLFSPAPNCLSGGVGETKYGNDCQQPRQSNSYWLTSVTEGKYAIERYEFDTGIVPNAGADWRTVQGEGVSDIVFLLFPYAHFAYCTLLGSPAAIIILCYHTKARSACTAKLT